MVDYHQEVDVVEVFLEVTLEVLLAYLEVVREVAVGDFLIDVFFWEMVASAVSLEMVFW